MKAKRVKRSTSSDSSPEQILGKRYADSLRERATVLRTDFLLSRKVRAQIAADLEALAQIAESKPESFKGVK